MFFHFQLHMDICLSLVVFFRINCNVNEKAFRAKSYFVLYEIICDDFHFF